MAPIPLTRKKNVSAAEEAFVQTIINRFEHHKHLIWIVAEEYKEGLSVERVQALAALITEEDDHGHVIGVHQTKGTAFHFADDVNIDQFAMQIPAERPEDIHTQALEALALADGRYHVNTSEVHPYHGDLLRAENRTELRRSSWASAMAGAPIMWFGAYAGTRPPPSSDMLGDLRRLQTFMESLELPAMKAFDERGYSDTKYVLAHPGNAYVAYSEGGEQLGLKDLEAGRYVLTWIDPASDETIEEEMSISGGDTIFERPAMSGTETVLLAQMEGALPVSLSVFEALLDDQTAHLTWETASETNNAGFEVEQAGPYTDESWNALAFIGGQGTTIETSRYSYSVPGLTPGIHRFRLKQIDFDGTFAFSDIISVHVDLQGRHALSGAYPNPFNPQTRLNLTLQNSEWVTIELFDLKGSKITTLFEGRIEAQSSEAFLIDGAPLVSGTYVVRVRGESFVETRKITMIK